MRRHERMQNRRAKRTKLDMSDEESSSVDQGEIHCEEELGTGCQTDLSQRDIDALQQELEETKAHLSETERACQRLSLNESAFEGDDRKVLFHTGLPTWELLNILLQYIQPDLRNRRSVTSFQHLPMTMMRLRLGLRLEDLSFRFAVSRSTIHRILVDTIYVLYTALADVIVWPDRDVLRATLPMDFVKHCPSCVVIIDCFEVFLERPTNLLARAQTFSSYKRHNTVKYLIGITPQGTVSYISQGWGGRVSDKRLTENNSILDNLLPGDTARWQRVWHRRVSRTILCSCHNSSMDSGEEAAHRNWSRRNSSHCQRQNSCGKSHWSH